MSEIPRFNGNPDFIVESVQNCIDRIGAGRSFGTVMVSYDQPDWTYGRAWIKAECEECGAKSFMSCDGFVRDMRYLAGVVTRVGCEERGHGR